MNHPMDFHPLTLAAKWHDSQAKIMRALARDAHAPRNAEYCNEQAGTHERWAMEIKTAARRTYEGKAEQ